MPPLLRSELPIRARTRHHPIVLFRKTHKITAILLGITAFAALIYWAALLVLVLELAWIFYWRYEMWAAEWIILTGKRVIRIQGIPETTTSEASLRIERVSGARIVQTLPGRWFDYGDIELEAPGDHPEVHKLMRLGDVESFYMTLREVIFGEPVPPPDPDDEPPEHITEPLPQIAEPKRLQAVQRRLRAISRRAGGT